MQDLKIYIMYYKKGQILPLEEYYSPVYCGQFPGKAGLKGFKDDAGEEISAKNPFYSELTGIYWVWKNTKQDLTGICHYRRYFTIQEEPWHLRLKYFLLHPFKFQWGPNPLIYTSNVGKYSSWVLTEGQAKEIFSAYQIILPRARKVRYSIERHYAKYHDRGDLDLITRLLADRCPDFLPTWSQVLQGNTLYANNMFVLPSGPYEEFMEWWFGMLFAFEQASELSRYQGYQQRVLGFVAERLLTLWVFHQQLIIKELPLIYFKKLKKE